MQKITHLFLAICAVVCLPGCGVLNRSRSVVTEFADYRPYTTAGMFISPDPYTGGDYTVIGEFRTKIYPAIKIGENRTYTSEEISSNEILQTVVSNAKKLGANGIVDYHLTTYYSQTLGVVDSYEVTALLILIHEPNE